VLAQQGQPTHYNIWGSVFNKRAPVLLLRRMAADVQLW
jgi:hypothetical protein